MQLQRRLLGEHEVPQHRSAGNGLATHRGKGAAGNAPAQHHHVQVAEAGAGNRADDHGQQGAHGGAGGADEIVHAHAHHLEGKAQGKDVDELLGVGTDFGGDAGKGQEQVKGDRAPGNDQDHQPDGQAQKHRVPQHSLCFPVLAFTQTQGAQGIAAHAREHGKGHEQDHGGVGGGGSGQSQLSQGLPQENGADQVVGAVDQHARNGGDGELGNESGNGPASHAGYLVVVVALRFFGGVLRRGFLRLCHAASKVLCCVLKYA